VLVGVTTYLEQARWGVWDAPVVLLPAGYPAMVRRAGAVAVLLPPERPGQAARAVERLDAVVVAGGPDVAPERYGARRDPRTGPEAAERDAWELAVLAAAVARGTPVLGVCRGMHLLNVLYGGTLQQHLDGHLRTPGRFASHRITPVPGTRLATLLPEPHDVPTHHHQAVDRLGAGLTASAHADDGTVEAVEAPGEPFVLGVQWHPEAGTDPRLARGLVDAAARRPAKDVRGVT
jgi:putative glutamine amidotransferase